MPPTDPMTDHTARSTHPLPSDPYSDDDTQPIVQAKIPAPTPAAGTGAAMTDPFNPSSIQPAAATATRSRFKSLRTRGRGWYSPVREVDDDHGRSTEGSEYGELDREGNDDGNEAERLREV
jgi:hypothetical protein